MRQLLEAGLHFGHQTRRWNPKMNRFIFGQRNGIYIIDLQKTLRQIHRASKMVRETAANGGRILFVGTKKQAQEAVQREAERCGMYYVNHRWLGGMLTNFRTVQQSVRRLRDLEAQESSGKMDSLSKKESSRLRKEMARLEANLSGIKDMERLPELMFVIDSKKEAIAVREAGRLGIPCIGVVDTNADPDSVDVPIPGNDDAIRAVNLLCAVMANAALDGLATGQKTGDVDPTEGPAQRAVQEELATAEQTQEGAAPETIDKPSDKPGAPQDQEQPEPAVGAAHEIMAPENEGEETKGAE
jgi:small subunit ribosomal protein S2